MNKKEIANIEACAKEIHKLLIKRGHKFTYSHSMEVYEMFYYGNTKEVECLCGSYTLIQFRKNNNQIKNEISKLEGIRKYNRWLIEIIEPTLKKYEIERFRLYNNRFVEYVYTPLLDGYLMKNQNFEF